MLLLIIFDAMWTSMYILGSNVSEGPDAGRPVGHACVLFHGAQATTSGGLTRGVHALNSEPPLSSRGVPASRSNYKLPEELPDM